MPPLSPDVSTASAQPSLELDRLRTLYSYDILDTEAEERYDRITRLAQRWLGVPVALLTFLDRDRQWFKSCRGTDVRETERDVSFCTYTIESDDVMVVEDAEADVRFASNPLVTGPPHVRFYAGAPLIMPNGHRIGTLCAIDTTPRTLSREDAQTLEELATMVADELEWHREATERRSAEHRYRTLFESAGDAVLLLRPDDEVVLEANERAAELYGVERGELVGRSLEEFTQNPARGRLLIEELHARGHIVFETGQVRADGTPMAVRVSASLIEYDGQPAILNHSRDVTALKQVEASLRLRARELQTITDHAPEFIARFDRDLRHLFVNRALIDAVGIPAVDYLGRTNEELGMPEEYVSVWNRYLRTVLETGSMATFSFRFQGKEYRSEVIPEQSTGDTVETILAITRDVTEQQRALDAVRTSENRYRSVIDSIRDAVLQTDTLGRCTFLSPAWERITGFSPEESLGRSITEFTHPDEPCQHDELFAPLVQGEASFVRFETRFLTKGGAVRNVEVHAQLLCDPDGTVVGTSGTVSDITDTVRFETEREARQQTEEMLRLKNVFLNNMSHEIRTPLTGILGFAEVLAEEVGEPHRDSVEIIRRSANRLLSTLKSIIDLAQLEGGAVEMSPQRFRVDEEIRAAAAPLRPFAERKGLQFHIEVPPVTAVLDRAGLNRIVNNLVGNAVKFTEAGHVTLRLEEADMHPSMQGPALTLQVSDTGIGINEAFLPHIFDDFKQASQGFTRSHEGSGVGLAITQRLVRLMGGTIAVKSSAGEGTTFTVTLPRPPAALEGAVPDEASVSRREPAVRTA